jgi:alpha-tubulin suppressor-like RCC1 family protein
MRLTLRTLCALFIVELSGLHAARADKIVAGGLSTCAITSQGALYCWGDNSYGELGTGSNVNLTRPGHTVADYKSGVTDVAVGYQFACAIVNGAAVCWGRNDNGQLGDGTTNNSTHPVQVQGFSSGVTAITAGFAHACLIHNDLVDPIHNVTNPTAYCWGLNNYNQLGTGDDFHGGDWQTNPEHHTPTHVQHGASVLNISAGAYHTCYIRVPDTRIPTALCWGRNDYGQLGDGEYSTAPSYIGGGPGPGGSSSRGLEQLVTYAIDPGGNPTSISAGGQQTCAIANNKAFCWGDNGELGAGHVMSDSAKPAGNSYDSYYKLRAISAGSHNACLQTYNTRRHVLYPYSTSCWGYNQEGAVGDGSTTDRATPVLVWSSESAQSSISVGAYHACAVLPGAVDLHPPKPRCWGSDVYGQVGVKSSNDYFTTPQVVIFWEHLVPTTGGGGFRM